MTMDTLLTPMVVKTIGIAGLVSAGSIPIMADLFDLDKLQGINPLTVAMAIAFFAIWCLYKVAMAEVGRRKEDRRKDDRL